MTVELNAPLCFAVHQRYRGKHAWNEERLQDLLAYVDSLTRVHPVGDSLVLIYI